MKLWLKQLGITLLFALVMAISVYGVIVPSNTPVTLVGAMQLASFDSGLSLFQDYRRLYYTFSPFNDYIIDGNNNRRALITIEELENNSYTVNRVRSQPQKIAATLETYLFGGTPDIAFETSSMTATYEGITSENTAQIIRTVAIHPNTVVKRIGSTISFHGDDLVFDDNGNVYNFWNERNIQTFTRVYGIKLSPAINNLRSEIPSGRIYIMNPHSTFILMLQTNENQIMRVNRDFKLIEIEEPAMRTESGYHTAVHFRVLKSGKEIL